MDRYTFGLVAWVCLVCFGLVAAQPAQLRVPARSFDAGRNVIFVTWDGVRRQEFLDAATMPYLWQSLAPTGVIYGDPRRDQTMTIGNFAFLSMPAYQSMFTGTPKLYGSSKRVSSPTFPERLRNDLGLAPAQVTTFSSWDALPLAVESQPGTTAGFVVTA